MLFELNPEKIEIGLSIKRGEKTFHVTHELRKPEEKDWLEYDKSLAVAMEDAPEGEGVRYIDNDLAAACRFWDQLAKNVIGYIPDGGALPENWKSLVPPEHKRAAILQLLLITPDSAGRQNGGSLFLIAGEESVFIRAKRGIEHSALKHVFKSPSPGQRIEFSRLMADSYIIRGNKNGKDKIVFPSRLAGFIRLYDDLILSVDGYCLNGNADIKREDLIAIKAGRQERVGFMDAQHKRAAIQELMRADQVELQQEEKKEMLQ